MRIGVTGIFASGKGTVCGMFQKQGAQVIDTDIIAREIVQPGSPGLKRIIEEFGDKFLMSDGTLDRRGLARYVFKDPARVERINQITHPLILRETLQRSDNDMFTMINTPLLFEAGFNEYMDKNIVVFAETDEVIERGKKRDGISENEIRERLSHQISLKEKIKIADYVIDNSGSYENTEKQVERLWKILTSPTKK